MNINLTDQIVSQFLSGILVVIILLAIGGALATILRGMVKKFPFTRVALVLSLAPLSLVKFLDYGDGSTLYLFAMISTLLGITIDGINHLLMPKERLQAARDPAEQKEEAADHESNPDVIVWEKAE